MIDHPAPEPDPCADLLRADPPPDAGPLREALLRQTRRVVRRRRWTRRLAVAAALAACYFAGIGTDRLATDQVPEPCPAPPDKPVVSAPAPPPTPEALEWQALDSPQPRPDTYREAGDRYIAEEGDYESALRCYRGALDSGSDKDLAVQPEDSWLLMALKDARQKEKRDEKVRE